jgi:hypothetical protein
VRAQWTVRYSVSSRQREKSFATLTDAQTFQLTLSTGKRTQGSLFVDPVAGGTPFAPLCDRYIGGIAKANAASKATYRSNFANPKITKVLACRPEHHQYRQHSESAGQNVTGTAAAQRARQNVAGTGRSAPKDQVQPRRSVTAQSRDSQVPAFVYVTCITLLLTRPLCVHCSELALTMGFTLRRAPDPGRHRGTNAHDVSQLVTTAQ